MKRLLILGTLALAACQTDQETASATISTGRPACDALLTKLKAQDDTVTLAMKARSPENLVFVARMSEYYTATLRTTLPKTCSPDIVKAVSPEIKERIPVLDRWIIS